MVPPISKGGGRFLGNEELKKGTRLEFSERRNVVIVVEATHRVVCLSPALRTLALLSAVSRGREENDDGALRPIIFPSLRNISTPLQRTNSFYSRCRATLLRLVSFPCSPAPRCVRDYPDHPFARTAEFALFQLRKRQ